MNVHTENCEYAEKDLECPFCNDHESEIHFLFRCPRYDDLRDEFIPAKYYNRPSLFRLTLLLSDQSEKATNNLANFVYKALQRRKKSC